MKIPAWWYSLPLFWKFFLGVLLMITTSITLVEVFLEPWAKQWLYNTSGEFKFWHEIILWALSILLPCILMSYALISIIKHKLDNIALAAKKLSQGDMTARVDSNENKRDVFVQLEHSFNDMAETIQCTVNNERRLLTDLSHELRSPLTRMKIAIELLCQENEPTMLDKLNNEVEQMTIMVENLLVQGQNRLTGYTASQLIDLNTLLHQIIERLSLQASNSNKKIEANIAPGLLLNGFAMPLRVMLENIITNAIFYTNENINIAAQKINNEILVSIRDDGPGVPEKYLQDIFRAFFRVDESRARISGGVGLGLALACEAVQLHGGKIKAVNTYPGLEVTVILPI